jgi:DNA-binding MarR family transcriptional regulator
MSKRTMTTDRKMAETLERISRVFHVLLWDTAKQTALSPLQIQILLYVRDNPESMGGVGRLAAEFGLTQATISDAVNTLITKGFLERRAGAEDRRLKLLKLTPRGRRKTEHAAEWMERAVRRLRAFSEGEKEETLAFMLRLVRRFHENGLPTKMHVCPGCGNFHLGEVRGRETQYSCDHSRKTARLTQARFNCPTWRPHAAQTRNTGN